MTLSNPIQTIALALNAEGNEVPAWIQLTPPGPNVEGRDGRNWVISNPHEVVAAFARNASDLPVDFEHATQIKGARGERAPAIGWIKELDVRKGAIWGRVDWTDEGQRSIAAREYRYVSPVFTFKKTAGDILKMVSAGLTNQPNLKMAALNNEGGAEEETAMNKAILEALGLSDGASEKDALQAINTLKANEQTALNRAENPDLSKFVPRGDYEQALNKITAFEEADKDRQTKVIEETVDAAIKAGKIVPSSRDYHIAACRADGGLKSFGEFVEASPVIADKSDLDDKGVAKVAKNKTHLDAEALAVCRQMGLTAEEYLKLQAEDGED